ncbi:MAG: hypothetical protein WBC91_13170 [Phototrophicaceae bacterium]
MATGSLHVNRDIILATKRQHLKQQMHSIPADAVLALAQMQNRPRGFLNFSNERQDITLFAHISRHEVYDPVTSALHCLSNGAQAIAFFTDHSIYHNDLDDMLILARAIPQIPVLYQNYTLNEYGVMAARASDASGIVAYSSVIPSEELRKIIIMAQRWKMTSMVQVNNEDELAFALTLSPHVIAFGDHLLNNLRATVEDLVTIHHTLPSYVKICIMQTIDTLDDLELVLRAPVDAVIVNERLLKQEHLAADVRHLIQAARDKRNAS